MLKDSFISYIIFLFILFVVILYVYWIDEDYYKQHSKIVSESKEGEEEGQEEGEEEGQEEETLHSIIQHNTPSITRKAINKVKNNLDGDWLCHIDNNGKHIELVKPIEHYMGSRGSQFARID